MKIETERKNFQHFNEFQACYCQTQQVRSIEIFNAFEVTTL